ncbi:hypothetical protein MYBA111488_21350 [Mycobacterium basiliense]
MRKSTAQRVVGDDECRCYVVLVECMLFGVKFWIRDKRRDAAGQACQQQLNQVQGIGQAKDDAICGSQVAVPQNLRKAGGAVMDLAMRHNVRRIVGGFVIPSRVHGLLGEQPRQICILHYRMTPPG